VVQGTYLISKHKHYFALASYNITHNPRLDTRTRRALVSTINQNSVRLDHDLGARRGIYVSSGLSSRPKTRNSKIDALKEIIRAWGLNPDEILTRNAMMQSHRTVIDQNQLEQGQLAQLTTALRQQMLREIRENQPQKSMNCRLSSGSPGGIRTLAKHM
jgi:hypothetical protein